MSVDLAQTNLVDQCAREQSGAFLANTNECNRLAHSQVSSFAHSNLACPSAPPPAPGRLSYRSVTD